MLSSIEQAFVGRDEKRAPLEMPAWEAKFKPARPHVRYFGGWSRFILIQVSVSTLTKISSSHRYV